MPTEDAYSSGHLVLSHFGTCICSNVETNLSWTCLVSGLLNFEHPSVLLFCFVYWSLWQIGTIFVVFWGNNLKSIEQISKTIDSEKFHSAHVDLENLKKFDRKLPFVGEKNIPTSHHGHTMVFETYLRQIGTIWIPCLLGQLMDEIFKTFATCDLQDYARNKQAKERP